MIQIIFDHPDFVVINKPAGIAVHAHDAVTMLDRVREHFHNHDIHPVHRLDLATSGLLIFAKTASANQTFCRLFSVGQVQKMYLALSDGAAKKKQGWIKGDMAKARGGSYKLLRSALNPAETYCMSFGEVNQPRLWWLRPTTGKTHQLRVALKSIAAPIIGDERYGGTKADRLYLHAWGLRFCYEGEAFEFKVWPDTGHFFNELINAGRIGGAINPWQLLWPKALEAKVQKEHGSLLNSSGDHAE